MTFAAHSRHWVESALSAGEVRKVRTELRRWRTSPPHKGYKCRPVQTPPLQDTVCRTLDFPRSGTGSTRRCSAHTSTCCRALSQCHTRRQSASIGVNRRQSASIGVNRRQSASIGVNRRRLGRRRRVTAARAKRVSEVHEGGTRARYASEIRERNECKRCAREARARGSRAMRV